MKRIFIAVAVSALALAACGPPKSQPAEEILKDLEKYAGKRVVLRGKFKSGARCHLTNVTEWQTYCKDCQYCKGPVVLDTGMDLPEEGLDDWPMILGGTYSGEDIRCKGPLNQVECKPFTPGKEYVVQGKIEAQRPPKLLVEKFWELEGS